VTAVNTRPTPPPAATREYTAEAFFSIQAPDEPAARRAFKDTLDAIGEVIDARRARLHTQGVEISLCMEDEHDPHAVEEL
jgi:hypothetical protein